MQVKLKPSRSRAFWRSASQWEVLLRRCSTLVAVRYIEECGGRVSVWTESDGSRLTVVEVGNESMGLFVQGRGENPSEALKAAVGAWLSDMIGQHRVPRITPGDSVPEVAG
jgi:hypothetical protein